MERHDIITVLLLVIIVFLSVQLYNTRINLSNNFNELVVNRDKEVVLFAGDSITEQYDLTKYYEYNNRTLINSGVGGYKTTHLIDKFYNTIEQYKPDKVFILIGTNDFLLDRTNDEITDYTKTLINKTKNLSPDIKIYVETIYPINEIIKGKNEKRNNKDIRKINAKVKKYCEENNITYIDMYSVLEDKEGNLKEEYTKDGLHLNDKGYEIVTKILKPYVEE